MPSQSHFKSAFEESLYLSDNQTAFCITAVLVWLLHIDGRADPGEEELLRSFLKSQPREPEFFHRLFAPSGHARERQEALYLAIGGIIKTVKQDRRAALLELMVAMTLADGYLTVAENHALRLLTDAFGLGPVGLDRVFQSITGKPLPIPSDPSCRSWWERRESGKHKRTRSNSKGQATRASTGSNLQRVRALATLGLDDPVTAEEIKAAYRRMCKVHHPDRFASLGDEAIAAATEMTRRIRAAYEFLERV